MKCEICGKNEAEVAVPDGDDELYVCRECERKDRLKRQKKSQMTRRTPDVEMTITRIGGGDDGEPPPIVGAIMNAFKGLVDDLEKASKSEGEESDRDNDGGSSGAVSGETEPEFRELPNDGVPRTFLYNGGIHLEGLHLIGELEPVKRALHALNMDLKGVCADGVNESAHVYRLLYSGTARHAMEVLKDLLEQEHNARVRIVEESPRVFGDSLSRALAILKNCRLLSPGELYDLLSPLKLAAEAKFLDGLTLREVERMVAKIDLSSREDDMEQAERDRADAARADRVNKRFADVILSKRAEERFL